MMISAVDDGYTDRRTSQLAGRFEPPESSAHDDYKWKRTPLFLLRMCHIFLPTCAADPTVVMARARDYQIVPPAAHGLACPQSLYQLLCWFGHGFWEGLNRL